MCFTRSSPTNSFYTMNITALQLVNSFNDLGLIFNCKLNFRNHITLIVNKTTCILRFIKRWAKKFSNSYVTKPLFTTLVRPTLDYGSVIWHSQHGVHTYIYNWSLQPFNLDYGLAFHTALVVCVNFIRECRDLSLKLDRFFEKRRQR